MRKCWLLWILLMAGVVSAQTSTCPVLEQAAISETAIWCKDAIPAQVCAGNSFVSLSSVQSLTELGVGTKQNLLEVDSVQTTTDAIQTWGIARLELRAYAVNTWDTERVTYYQFGNTQLTNTAQADFMQSVTVVSAEGVNIRSGAGEEYRLLRPAMAGETLKAVARLEDNSWVQILLRDGTLGWITSGALNVDLNALPMASTDLVLVQTPYLPFTHVNFAMSDTVRCEGASPSGLLIQTEKVAHPLAFQINGVALEVFGSVFVQTLPLESGANFHVYALEGEARIIANGAELLLNEGQFSVVTLSNQNTTTYAPIDTPAEARPYNYLYLYALPVQILDRPIYVPLGDGYQFLRPKPEGDVSPIIQMLATEPCRITTGEGGSNLRAGAGQDYPIMGVMGFRESASVIGRAVGTDGQNWWAIAPYIWVSGQTTVTGGDCISVPTLDSPPVR